MNKGKRKNLNSEKKRLNLFENYEKKEDNVTHGFLSALKCIDDKISKKIIDLLTNIKLKSNLIYDIQSPSPECKEIFKKAETGYILGISSIATNIKEDSSSRETSRADGWISDGKTVILIESKLTPNFPNSQLKKHAEELKGYGLRVKPIKPITWQQVDSNLKSFLKNEEISNVEKNILSEFRRYLQMEGITLDLEKFFNALDNELGEQWYSNEPENTLRLLKERILKEIGRKEEKKEQKHVTRMNYYWIRLFDEKINSINWRGTVYLNPDSVSVDVMAFKAKKKHIPEIVNAMSNISKVLNEEDKLRTWIYLSNYGKRRKVQRGRDYTYENLEYNLGKASKNIISSTNLENYARIISPKQMGIKYCISNPGSNSKTYWHGEGKEINYKDAKLLKDPENVIKKFGQFLNLSLKEIEK